MQKELYKLKLLAKAKLLAKRLINRKYKKLIINICKIGFVTFYINFKYSENMLFLLSLYELNRELENCKRE